MSLVLAGRIMSRVLTGRIMSLVLASRIMYLVLTARIMSLVLAGRIMSLVLACRIMSLVLEVESCHLSLQVEIMSLQVVSYGTGEVSEKATAMLKDIYGHLDTQLQSKQVTYRYTRTHMSMHGHTSTVCSVCLTVIEVCAHLLLLSGCLTKQLSSGQVSQLTKLLSLCDRYHGATDDL